jgi:tetratricopeptide (TPR) repeat protein
MLVPTRLCRTVPSLLLVIAIGASAGCSIKRMAMKSVAGSLAGSGDVYASDDDPELIRDATPFALKTMEAMLVELPENENLLLALCQGFTQYAFAFVQVDAELEEDTDYFESERMRERALRLYLRARDYGLRGLELRHEGVSRQLIVDPEAAVVSCRVDEVPLLYWTGAAWGAALSLGKDRPELIADLPAVVALEKRALALDEDYGEGAIHEVLMTLESLPANMGGSLDRAREHYERALELSGGRRAGTYVAFAENVAVQTQDRAEFERLLNAALAVDPDAEPSLRLQNLIVQRRARHLLTRVDDLFLDFESTDEPPADPTTEGLP